MGLKLTRVLKTGCVGRDVEGVARAMLRYLGDDAGWRAYTVALPIVRRTWGRGKATLARRCQAKAGIAISGVFGTTSEAKLRQAGAFDAYSDLLLDQYAESVQPPVDPALVKARVMLASARGYNGRYVFGGGHGQPVKTLTKSQGLDCSSSTSELLDDFDLLGVDFPQVSSWFEDWGNPGHGRYVTVHANAEHVWTEFTLPEGWFRFDTSPHGDGEHGPRVRTGPRPDRNFVVRHPAGL